MKSKPNILITTGDPEGIGPEITRKALEDPRIRGLANFTLIDSEDTTGFDALKKAALLLKKGRAGAVVTAPVNKSKINNSGIAFKGHTEFFAGITHTKRFAMMFCSNRLRVTIVTRHVALRDVPEILAKKDVIKDAILLTDFCLRRYFRIRKPRIGVSGLNPHCGEAGLAGTEDRELILPVVKKLSPKLPGLRGPIAADALFYMAYKGGFDAVVSMYHDQGLGPFKMIAFKDGVNLTLGLPFVRTSPGHGTAYDIAGKGIAEASSMKEAIKLAATIC